MSCRSKCPGGWEKLRIDQTRHLAYLCLKPAQSVRGYQVANTRRGAANSGIRLTLLACDANAELIAHAQIEAEAGKCVHTAELPTGGA